MVFSTLRRIAYRWGKKSTEGKSGYSLTDFDRQESMKVRALKREIDTLNEILETKDNALKSMNKDLKEFYETKKNDKWMHLAEKFLVGKNDLPNSKTVDGSASTVNEIISKLSPETKQKILEEIKGI